MSVQWTFPISGEGLTSYHRFPVEDALDSDLETFVREVLQNANDQGPEREDEPVRVRFRFEELTEPDVRDFLEVLQWNPEERDSLEDHLRWATQNDQLRVPGLKRFLDDFTEDRLLLLVVEDWNTTGLVGGETDGRRPYGALVQDWGSTDKPSSSSGGSHGLGKSVLWAFSGFSTVLFCSTPTDPPEADLEPPRLIGRTIVPVHEHGGEGSPQYSGHGWYGRVGDFPDIQRPPSVWGNSPGVSAADLASDLCLDRVKPIPGTGSDGTDEPGTSIGVVGFRVPGEDLEPDPEAVAPQIRKAAAKYFWPAIADGDLKVYVETPDGDPEEVTFDDAPGVEPFVECYQERFTLDQDTTDLSGPGSFVKTHVDLSIPRENGDVVHSDPHGEIDTQCDLIIRRPTPGELDRLEASEDLALNSVARLRGAQMVVDYVSMDQITTREREFVAVLACGTATAEGDPDEEARAAEELLTRAEPTQHDDWVGSKNNYLKEFYVGRGVVSAVEGLGGDRLEGALADVVGVDVDTGDEVPGLGDLIPVMSGFSGEGDREGPLLDWDRRPDPSFDSAENRWTFEGIVRPNQDEYDEWSVSIELVERDEEDAIAGRLAIDVMPGRDDVTVSDEDDTEVTITCGSDVEALEFAGVSERVDEPDINVGSVTQTETRVEGRVVSGGEG